MQMTTPHLLATLTIEPKCCLYSQWFLGYKSAISDAPSCDFHFSTIELSNLITTFTLDKVLFGRKILEIPIEISSWLTCLLQNQPLKEQWSKAQTRSSLSHGITKKHICYQLEATMTHSMKTSQELNVTKSMPPLLTQSEK